MRKLPDIGILDLDYAEKRSTKKSFKYRLWRRTHEIIAALEKFAPDPVQQILDLGSADGRMLRAVKARYPKSWCVGIEYDQQLARFANSLGPEIETVRGDVQEIAFPDQTFDAAILSAVVEHLPAPEKTLCEANRILKRGGIMVLTSPDPFWEYVATKVGHLKAGQHNQVMNLKQLSDLFLQNGFAVVEKKKFMLSPVGMPFEFIIEKWIRRLNLSFLLANQLVIGRCQ